ncbi:hypothetical protein DMB66_36615 [Actinoplanes sp. ATCC 53533]|uniref:hypothetical protein n=1 Tax=Actinoplanes sp. ATCC 53533 TaxID=1288362 RepID=UPI000F7724FD|nr:hypothetical protein [Actinoplanes sp. ATCC 53533]RSM54883.1 hypothetical protein DMB66_36615 [Actinoplanes sp. ATCC 53533]
MRRILSRAAVVATMVLAATLAGGAARATESDASRYAPQFRAAAAADGLLHAWEHQHAGGLHCTWEWLDNNWANCDNTAGSMKNKASDLWNNGYPDPNYDDVWLHWEVNNTEAYVCIGRGTSWPALTRTSPPPAGQQRITFWANTGRGAGEPIADNVASHEWGSC